MIEMSDKIFNRLSQYIHTEIGIKMPASKKIMLQGRLQKRLRILSIDTFDDYCDLIFNSNGERKELFNMIDVVSTNKTDFFREPNHFGYLTHDALPELIAKHGVGHFHFWSAGCSSGEEPYTLATVLCEFALTKPGFRFSILGTDISVRILKIAQKAIYEEQKVEPVPYELKKKYLLKSKDKSKKVVRIAPRLRSLVTFQRLNFMNQNFGINKPMDIIFCRNVVIYFDLKTQEALANKFYKNLRKGGYLFMGHSETLNGLNTPFEQVAPTVYRKL